MSNNLALEVLIKKRDELEAELSKITQEYHNQLNDLNNCIKTLGGTVYFQFKTEGLVYDDNVPTYISGTEDGI